MILLLTKINIHPKQVFFGGGGEGGGGGVGYVQLSRLVHDFFKEEESETIKGVRGLRGWVVST